MLAYPLNKTLQLIPHAAELVKSASVEEEFPVNSRESCLASALAIKYQEKIAHQVVSYDEMEKVAHAVDLYGLSEQVLKLTNDMVKAAHEARAFQADNSVENFMLKQANFQGDLTGRVDFEQVVSTATTLYKEAQAKNVTPIDEVVLYSGHGYMSKEAAVKALANRYYKTKNSTFVKLASAINAIDESTIKPETLADLGLTVYNLDKAAGLTARGHNFFTETMMAKEAAYGSMLNVTLAGKTVPYEKIMNLGEARIASFMGKDIADEMKAGPNHFKQVLETLPRDLQTLLLNLIHNV